MGRKKQAAPCRRTHPSTTVGAAAISTSPSEFVTRSDGCAVWAAIPSSSAGPANTSSPRPVATVTPPKHQNISPGSSKGAIIKRRLRRVPRRVLGSSSPSQSDVEDDIVLEQNNGMTPNRYSGSRMIHDAESDAQVDNRAASVRRKINLDDVDLDETDNGCADDERQQKAPAANLRGASSVGHVEIKLVRREEATLLYVDSGATTTDSLTISTEILRCHLPKTELVGCNDGEPVRLKTRRGVETVLSHCGLVLSNEGTISSQGEALHGKHQQISLAVADGLLEMNLIRSDRDCIVVIRLCPLSFSACSPSVLPRAPPIPAPRRLLGCNSLKYSRPCHAHTLREALGALLPNSLIGDVSNMQSRNSNDFVTAKMVYSVIDDIHSKTFEEVDNSADASCPLKVPGLVPKLRRYQDAAVYWMLKREGKLKSTRTGVDSSSIESERDRDRAWELCWVVLVPPSGNESHSNVRVNDTRVIPLPAWEGCRGREGKAMFYNPFSGWISESYDAARFMMVGGQSESQREGGFGILAESMGLGKSVEVIACVLAHKCPESLYSSSLPTRAEPTIWSTALNADEALKVLDSTDSNPNFVQENTKRRRLVSYSTNDDEGQKHGPKPTILSEAACICGRSGPFHNSLSWVVCNRCKEVMHGSCAGFKSEDVLLSSTRVVAQGRLCSDDCCPSCVSSRDGETISSRATLIVTPPSIQLQWQREIARHTMVAESGSPLKVVIYPGVKALCKSSASCPDESFHSMMHPKHLADADIVLVTFDVLMSDLGHSNENPFAIGNALGKKSLRSRKRYRVAPSPLASIKWWRVALDEAQRVETPTAASAKMALKLKAHHKWAVSGTPVGRGRLDDIFGLLLFLNVAPFNDKKWFKCAFDVSHRGTMSRLRHLLQDIMWRSTKANESVRKQMGIPEQIERKVILTFSSIERHFYKRQYEETVAAANRVIASGGTNRIRSKDSEILTHALQKLRAACCHPQVGSSGIGSIGKRVGRRGNSHNTPNTTSRILTMDQILEKLIDDARLKCEEAQRISTLHTNAMACLTMLKAEAKRLGYIALVDESEVSLLQKSLKIYLEALELAGKNSVPDFAVGEANLKGSVGFQSPRRVIRDGKATLDWHLKASSQEVVKSLLRKELWCNVDFHGAAKNISSLQIRSVTAFPGHIQAASNNDWLLLRPKNCILQASTSTLDNTFVDIASFTLSNESAENNDWKTVSEFRSNRSKSWRLVVKSFHNVNDGGLSKGSSLKYYIGIDIQVMEPSITADNLQLLHTLVNASLVLQQVLDRGITSTAVFNTDMGAKLKAMEDKCRKIESQYMMHAREIHAESQRQLMLATTYRKECQIELARLTTQCSTSSGITAEPRPWYEDVLSWFHIHGNDADCDRLCDCVRRDLSMFYDNMGSQSGAAALDQILLRQGGFPEFNDVGGFHVALIMRIQQADGELDLDRNNFETCTSSIRSLSPFPSNGEVFENSHCRECRADWHQTGSVCRHCLLEKELNKYQRLSNDPEIMCVWKSLAKYVKDWISSCDKPARGSDSAHHILIGSHKRAVSFFEVKISIRLELEKAKLAWSAHFDLLSDIDELNQCKRAMRLRHKNENIGHLTESEMAFIVDADDLSFSLMEHEGKQAMALAELRRNQNTLRYLKSQRLDRNASLQNAHRRPEESAPFRAVSKEDNDNCVLCLSPFEGIRSVLSCGHCFHTNCLERLTARIGSNADIICPMRCTVRTKKQEVYLAMEKRKDDGSQLIRSVQGDYGTKIGRLLSDVLDAVDLGDKSIIFSQWEDMIDIICESLTVNSVKFARPKSGRRAFGECVKDFRTDINCPVLVMNVKNGAEGLTLVEASHVFLVEPMLNCGLDMQAINRIHRIGQTSKTYVHRYIIENTIETKIDKLRMDRQENHFEDDLKEQKKHDIKAGGIDGGFDLSELHQLFS